MAYTYRFTGDSAETFPYLPADPPSRELNPGDTVECSEEVDHPRLDLVTGKAPKPEPTPEPTPKPEPTPQEAASA